MSICFDDCVTSATDAINKHSCHPSVLKLQGNKKTRTLFQLQLVDTQQVSLALKRIDSRKATGNDNLPGKIVRIAYLKLPHPLTQLINTSISPKSFPCNMKYAEINLFSRRMIIYCGLTVDPSMCWQLYIKYTRPLWTINFLINLYQS